MKKNYLLSVLVILLSFRATAQPVITHSGNSPLIGDTYNLSGALGSFDPGDAGNNQSWDFSYITPTFSTTITVVNPETTPFASEFQESTHAFHIVGSSESYNYTQISSPALKNVGIGFDPGGENEYFIHYTDAVKLMQYPFSYNNSFTDNYFSSYTLSGGMVTHERGTVTVTADAWGSVSTPSGNYPNTLRVKSLYVYTDSVWMMGNFVYANTYTETNYEWYSATSHYPVISISSTISGSTVTYSTDVVGTDDNPMLQLSIFPNPVSKIIHAKTDGNISEIFIINLSGKQLAQLKKTGVNEFTADISKLSSGVYMLRIKNEQGICTTKKFIKK